MEQAAPMESAEGSRLLEEAQRVLRLESRALEDLASTLDQTFLNLAERIYRLKGCLLVSGIGKAGLIGRKIAATLASTGTPSHFLHPAEALHGDLGAVRPEDAVLFLSHSGESQELIQLLPMLDRRVCWRAAVTGQRHSRLARQSDVCLVLPPLVEACRLGLAPTTSTTAMLGLGDALAIVLTQMRQFSAEDFAKNHPAGALGRRLCLVEQAMRPIDQCRVTGPMATVRDALVASAQTGRRSGAMLVVDPKGKLLGIFTDSDLARLLERNRDQQLDATIESVMTAKCAVAVAGSRLTEAIERMRQGKYSELPVVDAAHQALGMLDITDMLNLFGDRTPTNDIFGKGPSVASAVRPMGSLKLFTPPES